MRVDWKVFKKFVDDTEMYSLINYIDLKDNFYVWLFYQGQSFEVMLAKGCVDCEDFEANYKTKAILKDEISADGVTMNRVTHVNLTRIFRSHFVLIKTSTKECTDPEFFNVKFYNEVGEETNDGTQAIKTAIDFEPAFNYEIFGGGIECIEELDSDFYISAIIAPDVPEAMGGSIEVIRKKLILKPSESVFRAGIGTRELTYNPQYHSNKLRLIFDHTMAVQKRFQIEVQYYK